MALFVQKENALKTAQKAVNKLKGKEKKALVERLTKNVKSHYDHARAYISAVKAGKDVATKTKSLKARLDKGLVDSTTSKEYKDLAAALKKNQDAIKKVYEKSMRNGLTENYVTSANKVADTANLAISIKNYETLLDKALKAKDADKSIEYTNKLDQLFADAKKSGKINTKSKLYAGLSKTYTNQKASFHSFVYI
ncbi:hypothetical protein AN964_03485 [Heyndrickxia shackletonii]|uniref:SbsC C-terminal domain-containing protein n=1 Tax=Heyndrickxia shackletonii TaxID=157838 RepID=A0A0Q3TF53_9BACI|nr:hypothetical protein [Heyndrickxia shackletonii]KQL52678.1 hypothetical protein AN964_03485 [Heyndrickxia shackletonii]NEZ01705.1 hypothetical protein [Heyndrickxia shackletonii]